LVSGPFAQPTILNRILYSSFKFLQWISNYLRIGEYLQRQIAIRGHTKARAKVPLFQISTTSTNACQKMGQYRRFRWVDDSNRKSYSQSMEWLQMDSTKNRQL
jgi:hypothetical protein